MNSPLTSSEIFFIINLALDTEMSSINDLIHKVHIISVWVIFIDSEIIFWFWKDNKIDKKNKSFNDE